ncbi:MAG: hypothetical protein K9N07_05225 [Candidatus Cloacimonetes bacterium]|nr:hypothetical protein [Candidatus Cloacimonadota bacterium]
MKKIFLIVIIALTYSLSALSITWNSQEIISQNHSSFLEIPFDSDQYMEFDNFEESTATKSNLSVSSWVNFKRAWINFFSVEDTSSHFLEIHTPRTLSENNGFDLPLNSCFYFNIFTGADHFTNVTQKKSYNYTYYGTKLYANISDKLYLDSSWWTGHFTGDEDYYSTSQINDSWSQNYNSSQRSLDNVNGKIVYKEKIGALTIGRGTHLIGNNIGGSIILNNMCNDYGYFAGKLDFNKFSISLMHGTLIPDSTNVNELGEYEYKNYNDKYVAVKKLDWKPNTNVHLFAGEEIVYGGRSIDPSYLLPHTFLRATEHNLRDRDNVLIFGGLKFKLLEKNTFYLNLIFDELSKSKLFSDWWGNKYAFQIGNSILLNDQKNFRLTFEFTAVRPWMYTHKILHNKFSHDGIGLGFPSGSNLFQVNGEINYNLYNNLSTNVHFSFTKQGSLGNDFSINYETRPDDTATWLEGEKTELKEVKSILHWQPLTHHSIIIGYSVSKYDIQPIEHQLSMSYQASY